MASSYDAPPSLDNRTDVWRRAAAVVAAGLLAAATVSWATVPLVETSYWTKPTLVVAICSAVLGLCRLGISTFVSGVGARAADAYDPALIRFGRMTVGVLASVPWQQLLILAVLGLEALHPRRPWHTIVLALVLLAYLFALHLAESAASLGVFRPQWPLLAAGVALAAASGAAAALPAGSGVEAGWIAVLAAVAAVVVGGLALPV